METARTYKEYEAYDINPKSIITRGNKLSLTHRFPGYTRNPEGGVECRNHQELRSQDGIILEVMKRAGQQLLEGKNIVAISLPVRIFEPQSTITRITEIWGAGPIYLNKAKKTNDPIERMKLVITYAVAGLHMNIKQLKPFNPILGETYEGFWPDGTQIYIEHMSHHPPISRFLLMSENNWRFYGYYEYVAKLKGFTGNVIGGCFKGPNIVDFGNNDTITFNLPNQNITGLMYGKRIIEWDGRMDFCDIKNNIHASLVFTESPSFFQKFREPTDVFRGEIRQDDRVICDIIGSPVSHLMFGKDM
jgi:hypothetical protein